MEINQIDKPEEKKISIINVFKTFMNNSNFKIMQELFSKNEKYLYYLYAYTEQHLKLLLNQYKNIYSVKKRNFLYLKKLFLKTEIGSCQHKFKNGESNITIIFTFIFAFIIFLEVIKCKKEKNVSTKQLDLFNHLFSHFLHIEGYLYSIQIIKEDHLEALLKFVIILSMANNNSKVPNMNDNITNMMFLVQSIKIIKLIFNKLFQSKQQLKERQKELMKNIITFIKDKIIGYSDNKPLNIINKLYLANNDYYTTSLLNLNNIMTQIRDEQIKKIYIELLTNIYIFSFRYDNLMTNLLKIIEPLFLNIDKKDFREINNELYKITIILGFINELIKREDKTLQSEPLLREGFFLGNKVCGITSDIDVLEDEFSLIFGFCLYETNSSKAIKEWTLINIRSKENKNKEKISQIKIWLSKKDNSDKEYKLNISDQRQNHDTNIIIKSKQNYIFAFNFVKNKRVKISHICDGSGKINKTKEINLKFNIDNTYLYIGCDIIKKNNLFEEQSNTFFGSIGTVIILNNKKFSKKGEENIDTILSMKGDYASSILITLKDNDSKIDLINNEREFYFRNKDNYDNTMNLLTGIYNTNKIQFVEVIKTVISPHSFQLVKYQDDIDYSTKNRNYKFKEESKKEIEIRQNYLNFKQKSSSKTEKKIRIFSPFFSSRFNIFENKSSLEEFIKYDGIYYLSLFFEYYYQILCKIKCIIEN